MTAHWITTLPLYQVDDRALHAVMDLALARAHAGVIVPSRDVAFCAALAVGTPLQVIAGIAYPSGAATVQSRNLEVQLARDAGARGVCSVLPVGALRDGDAAAVRAAMALAPGFAQPPMFMLECCLLSDAQIRDVISGAPNGAIFVPGTGFAGADVAPDLAFEAARLRALSGGRATAALLVRDAPAPAIDYAHVIHAHVPATAS